MPLLTSFTALLAAIGPALATSRLSDGQSTEVIGAQEVGSTTMYGTMVYSMNYCTIVHSTHCYTSLSTGGPAPYHTGSSSGGYSSPPAPTYGQPGGTASSGSSVPIPTPSTVSSGGTVGNPPATTPASSSSSVPGGTYTSTTPDSSSTATPTPDVPTGAAVMGASVMGNVFVVALAALVV